MTAPTFFDESHAASYDQSFKKLAPMRDALHLVTRLALSELPSDARVLLVGAGTGAELLDLAAAHPGWRFTAVDPAEPMLRRCRERADAAGLLPRCGFHVGTVATLPSEERGFDGATSILVSQFIVDREARVGLFRSIADRLVPRAPLVFADLASPALTDPLFDLWERALLYTDIPPERVSQARAALAEHVGVLPAEEVAAIASAGGFDAPLRCFQTILIHGWLTRRSGGRAEP